MIAYKEIAQIKNVKGVNPVTGDYSYEENGHGYLYIDGVLLEKERPASQLVSVGEYTYAWYSYGCIEVYSGHTLLKVFEQKVRLLNGEAGAYIGHHTCDPKTLETGENILSVSDGQPLLAQNVPYRLYKVGEEIIGYRDFESKLSRLNSWGEALWTFDLPLRDSSSNDPDNLDHLEKVLGIAQGLLWICTRWYRLIALDLETGKPMHQFSGRVCIEDYYSNYTIIEVLRWCFFREAEKAIVLVSNWGICILNAATAKIIKRYEFSEVDPYGRKAFDTLNAPQLYGEHLTFIAERHYVLHGYRCAGIFDLKARKFYWIGDIISKEKPIGNHLLAEFPLQMAGDKLYIKDAESTLHIYQEQGRLHAQVRPQSEVISTTAQYIPPAVSATPPPTEGDRPTPQFDISLCPKIPRLLPYLIVLLLGMLIWLFRLDIFSPSHEHSTLASSLIITQDTKSQVVLLKEVPYFMRNRQRQIEEIFWSNISVDTLRRYPHYKVYYFLQTEHLISDLKKGIYYADPNYSSWSGGVMDWKNHLEDKVGEIRVIMREDSTYIYHMQLQSFGVGFDRIDHIFSSVSHYYSLQELYASKCEELGIKSGR